MPVPTDDLGSAIPDRFKNRTGLAFAFDTHFLDDESPEADELRYLHAEGWIDLSISDTVTTELLELTNDPDLRHELITTAAEYVQHLGPAVLDHSRRDFCVLGSEGDSERLDTVFSILYPQSPRATSRRQDVRDAMHVSTAIRYGLNGFITRDGRILRRQQSIKDAFNGFLMCDPPHALDVSRRFTQRARVRESG